MNTEAPKTYLRKPDGMITHVLIANQWQEADGKGVSLPSPQTPIPARFRPSALSEPSAIEMAQNFAAAVAGWTKAGFPVVTKEAHAARMAVCVACEFWDGEARFGLGKCKAPGCGCSRLKHWLGSEKCPKGKWPVAPS